MLSFAQIAYIATARPMSNATREFHAANKGLYVLLEVEERRRRCTAAFVRMQKTYPLTNEEIRETRLYRTEGEWANK